MHVRWTIHWYFDLLSFHLTLDSHLILLHKKQCSLFKTCITLPFYDVNELFLVWIKHLTIEYSWSNFQILSTACEPKIAFLVDTSPSIGRDLVDKDIVSFLANMETQLARLPRAPGDNRQGSNIHLVIFNKEANDYPLNSRNMSTTRIKRAIQSTLQETPIEGGTCISCGMELANAIIKYHCEISAFHLFSIWKVQSNSLFCTTWR